MSKKLFDRNVGRLFRPKFRRQSSQAAAYINQPDTKDQSLQSFKNTNIESTSSYRYGDKNYIVSTQQIRTDYSRFENHTFFHSAVANVNEAFDRIINFYPLEGNLQEIEEYEDTLTGFEKYVLDRFPKNLGYLMFSGSAIDEVNHNGTYVEVKDRAGTQLSNISRNLTGEGILDPRKSPLSIEFFCRIPSQSNDVEIILQKTASLANNITLALSKSDNSSTCEIHFGITSGSSFSFVTGSIPKNTFKHVTAQYDPLGDRRTKLIIGDEIHSSSMQVIFNNIDYEGSSLFIGTGSQVRMNGSVFTPVKTLSASIDDLKIFHSIRPINIIKKEKYKGYFPKVGNDDKIKLYYRFNEPYGEYTGNDIILDSSGNSLHATIENFSASFRLTGSDVPVTSENIDRNPVLFPTFSTLQTLNEELITSGSDYDDFNPNLITKLIPPHYFEEATRYDDFGTEFDKLGQYFHNITNNNILKKESEIPSVQLLLKLLLTWAKFFDELKIMIDSMTAFNHIEYDSYDTTPDALLLEKAKRENIELPALFRNASLAQFIEGINLKDASASSSKKLNEIQNLVWRRILSDMTNLRQTKGTIASIKSVFRSSGIEPDNVLVFREYGGSKEKSIDASREKKTNTLFFLNFTGSIGKSSAVNSLGYPTATGHPKIKSRHLSGSRTQVGNPPLRGGFARANNNQYLPHGVASTPSDGLFTSGSFTYEGLYYWPKSLVTGSYESLVRLHVTGTSAPSSTEACIVNLVAAKDTVELFIRDSLTDNPVKRLYLSGGINILDGDVWNVSFGKRDRHEFTDAVNAEYFLRAGKQETGKVIEEYFTSSHYANDENSVFKNISSTYNSSGSFLVIGSQSFQSPANFLNALTMSSSPKKSARTTSFGGYVGNIRFWSKGLTLDEWRSHVKNPESIGVDDPLKNYSFTNEQTGSFERLIIKTGKQNTTGSDGSGNIKLFDFSQNNIHFDGTNFETSTDVVKRISTIHEVLSDKFDLNFAKDKIRVRSLQDVSLHSNNYYASTAPVYEVRPSEEVFDDNRYSIDMSVAKGLNENILTMFSNLNPLENAIGRPNLIFAESYPELSQYRKIYFNNLLEKLDLQKYRSLFKWIDNAFTDVVYSLVPRSTNFLGINFVYESHVLERNRYRYAFDEIYLKALPRNANAPSAQSFEGGVTAGAPASTGNNTTSD